MQTRQISSTSRFFVCFRSFFFAYIIIIYWSMVYSNPKTSLVVMQPNCLKNAQIHTTRGSWLQSLINHGEARIVKDCKVQLDVSEDTRLVCNSNCLTLIPILPVKSPWWNHSYYISMQNANIFRITRVE